MKAHITPNTSPHARNGGGLSSSPDKTGCEISNDRKHTEPDPSSREDRKGQCNSEEAEVSSREAEEDEDEEEYNNSDSDS